MRPPLSVSVIDCSTPTPFGLPLASRAAGSCAPRRCHPQSLVLALPKPLQRYCQKSVLNHGMCALSVRLPIGSRNVRRCSLQVASLCCSLFGEPASGANANGAANGQLQYPAKPIRLAAPYSSGGTSEEMAPIVWAQDEHRLRPVCGDRNGYGCGWRHQRNATRQIPLCRAQGFCRHHMRGLFHHRACRAACIGCNADQFVDCTCQGVARQALIQFYWR